MKISEYVDRALALGFSIAKPVEDFALICEPELRIYCDPNQCSNFATTWVCPPGCGSLETCQENANKYRNGILLQTVGLIPAIDKENMLHELQLVHNTRFLKLTDLARDNGLEVLPLTTGGCLVCAECTFPENPCRDPNRRFHSLSAYGINVGKLCEAAGIEYSFRNDMVYFVAYLGIGC